MTKAENQAKRFADAVNEYIGEPLAHFWDKKKCAEKGYRAEAAVVLEETGFGAADELHLVTDSGYGKDIPLKGMAKVAGVRAEPYASWLLCFYND